MHRSGIEAKYFCMYITGLNVTQIYIKIYMKNAMKII